ncbi:MAG: alanine/glycine:cation symporter family protein [Planctomycetaceae bacterium]
MTRSADDLKRLPAFFLVAVSLLFLGGGLAAAQPAPAESQMESSDGESSDSGRDETASTDGSHESDAPPAATFAERLDSAVGVFNGWFASVLLFDIPLWYDAEHVHWLEEPTNKVFHGTIDDGGRVMRIPRLELTLEKGGTASAATSDPIGSWMGSDGKLYIFEKSDLDSGPGKYHVRRLVNFVRDANDAKQQTVLVTVGATKVIPFAVLWLILGASFFTVRMGFISLRGFKHAVLLTAGKYDDPKDVGEVSHFQALSAALSATVGLGNIAGVAIAISLGGPGATFWLIVAGFLGMTSKFVECTLGQMYREVRPDGRIMGGAMFYLSKGLKEMGLGPLGKVLAVMFALLCIGGSFGGGNAFQVNQSLNAVAETVPALQDVNGEPSPYRWIYGLLMTGMGAVVILGGIRRIAKAAEMIVPAMCGIYVLAGLAIILMNVDKVPGAFADILAGAFNARGMYGGFIGVLVIGFQRAAFSNEAGVGSAAIAHSAAKTDYPIREGMVALLEPFIDTIVVCTMSALVIVITGAFENPEYVDIIAKERGAALMSRAMDSQISGFRYVLSVSVFLFAYSTMISWSYYGERCCAYLFGDRSSLTFRIIFLVFTFLGSIVTAENVRVLSDLMILGMAFPNILGLFLLSGKVRRALSDYWRKFESGEFKMTK